MPPPKNKMDPAGAGPPPLPHMQAGSPTNTGTSSDEIAQRFAGFFFRVLATEPEKVGVLFLRVLVRAMPRSGIPKKPGPRPRVCSCGAPCAASDAVRRRQGVRAHGTGMHGLHPRLLSPFEGALGYLLRVPSGGTLRDP